MGSEKKQKDKEAQDDLQHEVVVNAAKILLENEEKKDKGEPIDPQIKTNEDGTLTVDGIVFERKEPEKVAAIEDDPEKKRFAKVAI
ncbi:unnamed protein product, partial [marine sediment metagenome]